MKVVIIGLGSIGRKHVDALLKISKERFDIYALRRPESTAPDYTNVTNIYDLSTMDFQPDFFIISNPTSLHFETIQKLLNFNKPLFIEKPLVMKVENGEVLADALAKKPVLNYVGCNLRFLEVLRFAKQYITDQNLRVNEVNIYGGSHMPSWRPHLDFRKSYSANKEMGGGIHLDFIHDIDYLFWFFGAPNDSHKVLRSQSSLDISAIDYANYTYFYDNFVASVILNYFRKDRKRIFEIVCKNGTLLIEVEKGKVYFDEQLIFQTEQSIIDTYTDQMKYFINCIETKTTPMNEVSEAFEILKMCLI